MSDPQTMQAAQLDNLRNENEALRKLARQYSAQTKAQKKALDEYLTANINLKSSLILIEEDMNASQHKCSMLEERVKALESDKEDLIKQMKQEEDQRAQLLSADAA